MHLKTVLVFAHECAPYNRAESTIGAQRPAQFAKYLPKFGWRAIVICCDSQRRNIATANDFNVIAESAGRMLKEADPRESVIIPTPSLVWDGLLDRCWRGSLNSNSPGAQLVRKAMTAAKFLTGDYSQSWQPCAQAAARAVTEAVNIDLCIGEHGPDAGLFLARWFSKQFEVKWIADFRDPMLQPLGPLARGLYSTVARRLVSTATTAINVNPVWSEQDRVLFGIPCQSIPNGFDPDEFDVDCQPDRDKFTIAYLGSITSSQRLEIFLEGIAQLRSRIGQAAVENVRVEYAGAAARKVRDLAARFGVSELVDARDRVDRSQALAIMKSANVLLLLSIAEPEAEDFYFRNGYYPAKTFEYFGARKQILCVPGDRGQLEDLLAETRTGVVLRTASDVVRYLERALEEWKRGGAPAYDPNEDAVARFTRRNLTERLAKHLDDVVGPAGNSSVQGIHDHGKVTGWEQGLVPANFDNHAKQGEDKSLFPT